MTTENTEIDKEMDDVTLDNNEWASCCWWVKKRPIDTRLSERKKINIYGYLQNLKIIKGELQKSV
jgi:hypothetical protein